MDNSVLGKRNPSLLGPSSIDPAAKRANVREQLKKRLDGKGGTEGARGEEEGYVVVPDPRFAQIQKQLITRWQQTFVKGQAEGRAGEDQQAKIGQGPRKTIDCISMGTTKYKGVTTGRIRKTRTQRLIEQGNVSTAINRMNEYKLRNRPNMRRKAMKKDYDPNTLSSQFGLLGQARQSYDAVHGDNNNSVLDQTL